MSITEPLTAGFVWRAGDWWEVGGHVLVAAASPGELDTAEVATGVGFVVVAHFRDGFEGLMSLGTCFLYRFVKDISESL